MEHTHTHCHIRVSAYIFCWRLIGWSQMDQKLSAKQQTPKLSSNCNLVKTFTINHQSSSPELMPFCPGALPHVCIISGSQMLSWSLSNSGGSWLQGPFPFWCLSSPGRKPPSPLADEGPCRSPLSPATADSLQSPPFMCWDFSWRQTDTHTHLPTHPCSFWIPSKHGILCSSWWNSWPSCLYSPSSISWTSSSDSCQPSFLHLDLLRSGSLRASMLLTSEWLGSQSLLHEPSNSHILFPKKPFFNGALWATYFLGFLFFFF